MREPAEPALNLVFADAELLRVEAVRRQAPRQPGKPQELAAVYKHEPARGRHRHARNSQTGTLGPACGVRR